MATNTFECLHILASNLRILSLTLVVCAPLHDNAYRDGPRSITFREYKYSLGMLLVSQRLLLFIISRLSHSFTAFDDYSQEEQGCSPWNP